jgi:Cu2+-containing amine oxidase
MHQKVLKEVHDDGLRWMNGKEEARRGEKMLLWALFSGGTYRYLIEYGFGDDGTITCRLGATAHNFFDKQKDGRDVHLHVGCWRFDPELAETGAKAVGGAAANQALLVRRVPRTATPDGRFRIDIAPFNADDQGQAREGFADWKAEEFTVLRVQSLARKNSSKEPQFSAYDLLPMRQGAVRNYPWKYAFANHDFWVTHRNPDHVKYQEAPLYATRSKVLDKSPLTIWHNSPAVHVPRGEDYGPEGSMRKNGAAITTWVGFTLRPVNLFDSTPLYPLPGKQK